MTEEKQLLTAAEVMVCSLMGFWCMTRLKVVTNTNKGKAFAGGTWCLDSLSLTLMWNRD